MQESAVEREALLDSVDFPKRLPTNEELQKEASLLEAMTGHHSSLESFLVVPFTLVPDLVAKAQLVLRRGEAFVCKADGLSILTTLLREHLERVMETTALELANHADERLQPFVQYLGERWRQYSLTTNVLRGPARSTELADIEHLTAGDIENVSSHFPPCMRVAYERLKTDGHLKYQGRQQLTLFLKGIHLPLPEALKFWRQAFGRKHSEDVFQREYAYSIRHNYGQEGKRANYGCLPCTRIIATVPTGPLETHGCPFRTHLPSNSSDGRLEETLKAYYGLDDFEAGEMADLARRGHQQLACTKALEGATHRTDLPTVIVPTDFYFTHRSSSHSP
jgi:DNA primase large subunit